LFLIPSSLLLLPFLFSSVSAATPADIQQSLDQLKTLEDSIRNPQPGVRVAAATVRSQAKKVASDRAKAFQELIQRDPASALQIKMSESDRGRLAQTFPESTADFEQTGQWEGDLEYLVIDEEDLNHRTKRMLRSFGEILDVTTVAADPADMMSGQRWKFQGVKSGEFVAAADGELVAEAQQYEAAAMCGPTGAQSAVVLLVNMPGATIPTSITLANVEEAFNSTTQRSVNGFWQEASYGKTSVNAKAYGWYTLPQTMDCNNQYYAIRDEAIKLADADINFQNYSRVFIVINGGNCSWAGLGVIGCSYVSSPGDGNFTASTSWLKSSAYGSHTQKVQLSIHEGGHNLGLGHASSRDFGTEALGPLGAAGALSTYGDSFSTMGNWNFGHYASPHKVRLNWLASTNYRTINTPGTYVVDAYESSLTGPKALKIQRGTGNSTAHLWLEYRQPIGNYDSQLGSQIFSGALLHYQDANTSATHLLDFTPETTSWTDPALAVGRTWVDPYSDLHMTMVSKTATTLTVQVGYGNAPTDTTAPSAPSSVNWTPIHYSSMTLAWTAASDNVAVTGYRLDVSLTNSFSTYISGYQNADVGNVLTRAVTGLSEGTTYYARIRAYDAAGNISGNSVTAQGVTKRVAVTNLPPTVTLTSPASGATFTAPASISLAANAVDADGSINRVEFYRGTVLLNTDTSSPYGYNWLSVVAGTYTLTARAYDEDNAVTTSAGVTIVVHATPNISPSVTLTSPANGATFTAPASISMAATATDSDGTISRVEFFSGSTLLSTDTSSPYSFSWTNVAAGTYTLTAHAFDNDGAEDVSPDVVVVVHSRPNVPPTIALTSPVNGATFIAPATVSLAATASDSDGTVSRVEFYRGPTLIGTDTGSPYSFSWTNVAQGTYTLTARAYDDDNAQTTSVAATIVVHAPPNGSPTVTLTSPADNATFTAPASVSLAATAIDTDGVINRVEFYNGATLLGTDTSSPYSYTWLTVAAGTYTLTARVYDDDNAQDVSPSVTIVVHPTPNVAPSVSLTSPLSGASFIAPAVISLAATASDTDGTISRVEFYRGTTLIGTDTSSPYSFNWTNVSQGTYTLTARAYDNRSAQTTSAGVTVVVHASPNASPTVDLTSPVHGATFTAPASIAMTAAATDTDGTINRVEFYRGSTLLGTDTSSPYSFTWMGVAGGTYTLTARAYDDDAAMDVSPGVTVIVHGLPNLAPTIELTDPVDGESFIAPASISLAATATDSDGSISRVEFYQGSTRLGTDTSNPYTLNWTNVSPGTYTVFAVAYDNRGATNQSSHAIIDVADPDVVVHPPETPNLTALDGQTFAVNQEISFRYDTPYTGFSWLIEPQGTVVSAAKTLVKGMAIPAGAFPTSAPRFNLSSQGLTPGAYRLTVWAQNDSMESLPATANIALVPGTLDAVRVYPNPWRSDRHTREITFDGLSLGATVKIFNTAGHLVRELTPSGTTARWDRKNSSGDTVASGIYIFLIKDALGGERRGKLAIVK